MPIGRIAGLIRQIARAVTAAHCKGVLHRDLKPENIMLEGPGTPDECVRLIDFGIARLEEAEGALATRTTQFAGTTPYMAPEQLRGKPCPASDTYGMAVVAYEMLAGRRPFLGAGPIEIYEQQRSGASLKPLIGRGVPEPAARLIAKQLAFRPEERSASALEAGDAISDALLHPRRQILSRRHTIAALAGTGVAGAGAGFLWWTRRRPLSDAERVIELPAGAEPLEHGFQPRNEIVNRAILNADATVVEALRFISNDQGAYCHPLHAAQAAAANRLGWKATFEAAAEEGVTLVAVDIANAPVRYAVNVISTPGKPDVIRLVTGFAPAIHGAEMPLPGPAGARHRYVLALPPESKFAELWVDSVKRYSGYTGTDQYLYRRGPELGVTRYRSARGAGVFWGFRFEIG